MNTQTTIRPRLLRISKVPNSKTKVSECDLELRVETLAKYNGINEDEVRSRLLAGETLETSAARYSIILDTPPKVIAFSRP